MDREQAVEMSHTGKEVPMPNTGKVSTRKALYHLNIAQDSLKAERKEVEQVPSVAGRDRGERGEMK
jgi:hypothetical protein